MNRIRKRFKSRKISFSVYNRHFYLQEKKKTQIRGKVQTLYTHTIQEKIAIGFHINTIILNISVMKKAASARKNTYCTGEGSWKRRQKVKTPYCFTFAACCCTSFKTNYLFKILKKKPTIKKLNE